MVPMSTKDLIGVWSFIFFIALIIVCSNSNEKIKNKNVTTNVRFNDQLLKLKNNVNDIQISYEKFIKENNIDPNQPALSSLDRSIYRSGDYTFVPKHTEYNKFYHDRSRIQEIGANGLLETDEDVELMRRVMQEVGNNLDSQE